MPCTRMVCFRSTTTLFCIRKSSPRNLCTGIIVIAESGVLFMHLRDRVGIAYVHRTCFSSAMHIIIHCVKQYYSRFVQELGRVQQAAFAALP